MEHMTRRWGLSVQAGADRGHGRLLKAEVEQDANLRQHNNALSQVG
jgi:hypothetical protein